jgi:plastocyanin domain-containing protein
MPLAVFALAATTAAVGCDRSNSSSSPMSSSMPSTTPSAIQAPAAAASLTQVTVDERGFTPNSIAVSQGQSTTLEFVRTSDGTCAKEVVVPALGVSKALPLHTPVDVSIPAGDAKTYAFACGMGMFKGQVVVR